MLMQVVKPTDPRIHFALVCGAKSCPPIKVYTPDSLEDGLDSATMAFCEGRSLTTCQRELFLHCTIQLKQCSFKLGHF